MADSKPAISVIVCTLNEEKRIQTCLEHLRGQQFNGSLEIILADGMSEDKTVEIARPLVDKIVLEKVRRISAERQAGAGSANGKILVFTDADSRAPADWLQKIWNAFERHPTASFVYGPVFVYDVPGWERAIDKVVMKTMLQVFHWVGNFSPIGSNIAMRKEFFDKIGGFNTRLVTCEDLDLAKRSKAVGKMVYDSKVFTNVSARRIKKWGYLKYVWFHLTNGFKYHSSGDSSKEYEDVR